MLAVLKDKLFPCERIMKALRDDHAESVRKNQAAHNGLRVACGEGICFQGNFIPKIGEPAEPKR